MTKSSRLGMLTAAGLLENISHDVSEAQVTVIQGRVEEVELPSKVDSQQAFS